MNELTTPNNSNELIFNPDSMANIIKIGELMASSQIMIPAHLQGKPADCIAVAMQAASWGMNPFTVAQKTHTVNGILGYEAQLVSAVIKASGFMRGSWKVEYVGDWSKWQKGQKQQNAKGKWYTTPNKASEKGLGLRVGAVIDGEDSITWGNYLYLENIEIRNSPLWQTSPAQQLAYLAQKYFVRLYAPHVIQGVYDQDELAEPVEKEINPIQSQAPQAVKLEPFTPEPEAPAELEPVASHKQASSPENVDLYNKVYEMAFSAQNIDQARQAAKLYNESKASFSAEQREVLYKSIMDLIGAFSNE